MKKILVPVDFSDQSLNALNYAADVSLYINAELVILHVYNTPPATDIPVIVNMEDYENLVNMRLSKLVTSLEAKYGNGLVIRTLVRMGFVVEEINIASQENKADLIVMGMNGADYVTERILGSITTTLIRKSKKPVLVVGNQMVFSKWNKILLATDGERMNGDIYNPLKMLLKISKAHLYIVHIQPEAILNDHYDDLESFKLDEEWLRNSLSFHHINSENVTNGLNEFINNRNVEMVVMIPHKHDFFERLLHEPQTQRMAFQSTVPLLTLPE